MDRVNTKRAGRIHICGDVVDIDGAFRIYRKAPEQRFEDAGIRLVEPDLTGDQNAAKPA